MTGQFNLGSVVFRMFLSIMCSGVLGLERENKNRPAGFRTYMLVSLGACITMLLGQYEFYCISGLTSLDVSRFGAQVINGIGFLGAGSIIVTAHQEVKGLTTAAGLWASACMGLAIGAGNYMCALIGFGLIIICFRLLPYIERHLMSNSKNMNVFLEFDELTHIHPILTLIKEQNIQIYEVEIMSEKGMPADYPSAIFSLRLDRKQNHAPIIAFLSDLEYVLRIEEI